MKPSTPHVAVKELMSVGVEHIIVVHGLFNMNTRAPGISVWEGVVLPIYNVLDQVRSRVHQLPCLEAAFTGLRRWWFVKEQYDNLLFREMCYRTALVYARHLVNEGVGRVKVLGAGLSPTCGFRETQSDPTWGGMPRPVDVKGNVRVGRGVFFEQAPKAFEEAGLHYEVLDVSPAILYPGGRVEATRTYPRDPLESVLEVCSFLKLPCSYGVSLDVLEGIRGVDSDRRSGKNLVVPREAYVRGDSVIRRYVDDGYGLVIIEDLKVDADDRNYILKIHRLQLGNQILAGQEVVFYSGGENRNTMYNMLLERMMREFKGEIKIIK